MNLNTLTDNKINLTSKPNEGITQKDNLLTSTENKTKSPLENIGTNLFTVNKSSTEDNKNKIIEKIPESTKERKITDTRIKYFFFK